MSKSSKLFINVFLYKFIKYIPNKNIELFSFDEITILFVHY